jgi:hypothetical protein
LLCPLGSNAPRAGRDDKGRLAQVGQQRKRLPGFAQACPHFEESPARPGGRLGAAERPFVGEEGPSKRLLVAVKGLAAAVELGRHPAARREGYPHRVDKTSAQQARPDTPRHHNAPSFEVQRALSAFHLPSGGRLARQFSLFDGKLLQEAGPGAGRREARPEAPLVDPQAAELRRGDELDHFLLRTSFKRVLLGRATLIEVQ